MVSMNGDLVVRPVVGELVHPDPGRRCVVGTLTMGGSTSRARRVAARRQTGAQRGGFLKWRSSASGGGGGGAENDRGEVGDELR
jgi:hypothetical protein